MENSFFGVYTSASVVFLSLNFPCPLFCVAGDHHHHHWAARVPFQRPLFFPCHFYQGAWEVGASLLSPNTKKNQLDMKGKKLSLFHLVFF